MSKRIAAEVVQDQHFINCCTAAKVQPTKRQARKFLRGEGSAKAAEKKGLKSE